jgi:ankyrin repeat protein
MSNIEKMMLAIRENQLEEVKQLYKLNANILFEKDREKDTPILKACRNCNAASILAFLLEKGANIEDTDSIEQTPLIIATQHGCEDLVKMLLEKGANMHRALAVATEENHLVIAKMLLDAGADPNEESADGETLLEIALRIHRGKQTALSKLFDREGEGKKRKKTQRKKQRKKQNKKQNKRRRSSRLRIGGTLRK